MSPRSGGLVGRLKAGAKTRPPCNEGERICGETGIPDDGLPQSDYSSSEITVELKAALASSSLAVEARMTAVLESPTFTK